MTSEASPQPDKRTAPLKLYTVYAVAYGLAALVGTSVFLQLKEWPILLASLLADIAATFVIFAFSRAYNNSSLYDPYWSVAPLALCLAFFYDAQLEFTSLLLPFIVSFGLLNLWSHRLTFNFFRAFQGLGTEDFRYTELRRQNGRLYWLVSLFGIHLFPTLLTWASSLPLWALTQRETLQEPWLFWLGAFGALAAVYIEATADQQLHVFRQSKPHPTALLETGLWKYSRHPNYFGEISFWWSILLMGIGAIGFQHDAIAEMSLAFTQFTDAPLQEGSFSQGLALLFGGALCITLLFRFISLGLIEKRMLKKRPAFAQRQRLVSAVIPLPPKRSE